LDVALRHIDRQLSDFADSQNSNSALERESNSETWGGAKLARSRKLTTANSDGIDDPEYEFDANDDDLEWADCCSNRRRREELENRSLAKRERADPLVLCGHGVSLRVDAGTLLIRNGFTHYPQKQDCYRYFKGDAATPSRIIVLDGSGSITFDVLSWLAEQNVPLVKIDWTGNVVSVVSGDSFAANRHRAAWQAETRSDPRKRMEFCNALIMKKIEGCILTLEKSLRRCEAWERAMHRAYADLSRIELDPPKDVDALRGLEANSAATYFRAWRAMPLRWRESARHPIPEDWRSVGSRTSRFHLAGNRNASHPVNAILNYAYAVLQSQVQIKAVAEGYDPMLGIMHYERDGSPAFVFDLMEPERPKVDRAILGFLKSEALHPVDFTFRADGVVRLSPELTRRVAGLAARGTLAQAAFGAASKQAQPDGR
jgi:CRISPR-associated protein Cas1